MNLIMSLLSLYSGAIYISLVAKNSKHNHLTVRWVRAGRGEGQDRTTENE